MEKKLLQVKFSQEDLEKLKEMANENGLALSSFARYIILKSLKKKEGVSQ